VRLTAVLLVSLLVACAAAPAPGAAPVEFTILHLNDVYEMAPVSGGREGGLARVATLRKRLLDENPSTLTVFAGDLFSPSALATVRVDGERLEGRHMVAAMNAVGLDFATFGNHEFDVSHRAFLDRLRESRFAWISSNVFDREGKSFPGVARSKVVEIRGSGGNALRLGIFGLTADINNADYVGYADFLEAARTQAKELRGRVDVLVALTHLTARQDIALAEADLGIDLILGGHDHENMQSWRGPRFVPVFKADANARSAYVHRIRFDLENKELTVRSVLQRVTDRVPEDPATLAVVRYWTERAFASLRAEGFEPEQAVAAVPVALDGLESSVRNYPTALTSLIAEAMRTAVPGAELAIFNSGAIRVDDILPPGPLTQLDVIRILPFGGRICQAEIEGALLRRILDQGLANLGNGGYLHAAGVTRDKSEWRVTGEPFTERIYRAAIAEYLLAGREQGLAWLTDRTPGIRADCDKKSDIRFALIAHLQKTYGGR
jgi:5'-nucleotidase